MAAAARVLTVVLPVITLLAPALAFAEPRSLTGPQQRCLRSLGKYASRAVAAHGKALTRCVKEFGSGRSMTNPFDCVAADEGGKIATAQADLAATIQDGCTIAYPVDCLPPCDATDAAGATAAVDDADELDACLACMNEAVSLGDAYAGALRGVHGRLLGDGSMLASRPGDPHLAHCEYGYAHRAERLLAAHLRTGLRCLDDNADRSDPPYEECLYRIIDAAAPVNKLVEIMEEQCPDEPVGYGYCAGLADSDLAQCIMELTLCARCRWTKLLLGATADCDYFDDDTDNASCD